MHCSGHEWINTASCLKLKQLTCTCLNLEHGQILIGPESEGEDKMFVVICKVVSSVHTVHRPRKALSRFSVLLQRASSSTTSSSPEISSSSWSSPGAQILAVQAERVEELADVVRCIMGPHAVSVSIDLTFLEMANSLTNSSTMSNWSKVKAVLPYCKHSYMLLSQLRKLLSHMAHLCTAFHTVDDNCMDTGLLYTHHVVFDVHKLLTSESIENKLRYMKYRGVQQPNTPASLREQLQKYWPEEEVLERLMQEVLEEAKGDFFALVDEGIMSTLWSKIVWKFEDLDNISVRMCMSRNSLCSSNAFLAMQSSSVSPFTVLPLFIGVDSSGQMLLQGRDGAVHYIVNNFYMHLIETTLSKDL
jgi:hypothetical protein